MRWSWLAFFVIGCGSRATSVAEAPDTSEVDAAIDTAFDWDAAVTVPVGEPLRCGPGPWMAHRWQQSRGFGKRDPIAGSKFGIDLCPNMSVTSGADGAVMLYVTKGATYSILIDDPPEFGGDHVAYGEFLAVYPRADAFFLLKPPDKEPWSKRVDASQGVIHAMPYTLSTRAAPCDDYFGTSFEVVDHPEAHVHYFDGTNVEVDGGTEVPPGGSIWINGIAAGTRVTLRGRKEGCVINPWNNAAEPPHTVRVFAGRFTQYAFQVAEPPVSDAGTD